MFRVLISAIALLAAATSFANEPLSASSNDPSKDKALEDIIESHWEWTLKQYPEMRREYGDNSGNQSWTNQSLDAYSQRNEERAGFIRQLQVIEPATLSGSNQLNRAMLLRALRESRTAFEDGMHLMPMSMRSGPQHRYQMAERLPFNTEQDYRDWLARLEQMPQQLAEFQALMESGIEQDRVQAAVVMSRVPTQISRVVQPPAESPFYRPFADISDKIPDDTAAELQAAALKVIDEQLNPAYEAFGKFISDVYLPACREQPGIGALDGGKAVYARLAQQFTTTDMTPEQIHEIGLSEVARIRGEMEAIIAEVNFDGDIAAFNEYLRTDPQFYFETAGELLEAYQSASKRLDPGLVKLFGRLPRAPYGVRPIAAEVAPDTTTAYYSRPAANGSRPGWYYVNLYRPEVRPKYEIEVLSVHEAVPGHHLQIALAQELEGVPEFRKNSSITAFIEGWGLYSERLGYDMGLYEDPYSRYGQKVYDMWRAVRLVVDTGIHYLGWSRDRAIEYFKANAAKSEADIINEIDRYIGWPGQALAYKIGQLKMLELRARAESTLGDAFDIRAFHDELLGAGAIPLSDLEARMDAWIAAQS